MIDDRVWLTLQEASKITGKSSASLRGLALRNKFDRVKKKKNKKGEYWVIHRDELKDITRDQHVIIDHVNMGSDQSRDRDWKKIEKERSEENNLICETGDHDRLPDQTHDRVNTITIDYYDRQREKWEEEYNKVIQGMMMYRYKYEDLENKIKLLPAPVEVVNEHLKQKEELEQKLHTHQNRIEENERIISELNKALEEERKKPWWKKILKSR